MPRMKLTRGSEAGKKVKEVELVDGVAWEP